MTPPQRRLWRLEREEGREIPQYAMEREGHIDLDRWGSARGLAAAFVARHEILRTRVALLPDGPWLDVDGPDLSGAHVVEAAAGSGAPEVGLPERVAAVVCEQRGTWARVAVTLHHLLIDSWGWQLLVTDFDGFVAGTAPAEVVHQPSRCALPPATAGYERNLLSERARLRRRFTLEGSRTARTGPHEGTLFHDGSFAVLQVPGAVFATLRRARAANRTTDFVIWHAALGIALSRHLSLSRMAVHSVLSNRTTESDRRTAGCLSGISVFDISLPGDGSVASYVRDVAQEMATVVRSSPYDDGRLIDALADPALPDTYPCVAGTNLMYPLHKGRADDAAGSGGALAVVESGEGYPHREHYVLTLSPDPAGPGLLAETVCSSALPGPLEMLRDVIAAVGFVADHPAGRIGDFGAG